jgi:hypothetical protein
MLRFVPMILLMGGFTFIGTYLMMSATHFIDWTMKYNYAIHRQIDSRLAQPVLVSRAQNNYGRLKENGGLTVFTWSVRAIGTALTLFGIITICHIISSF